MIRLRSLRLGNLIIYRGNIEPYSKLHQIKTRSSYPMLLLDNKLFAYLLSKYDNYIGESYFGEISAAQLRFNNLEQYGFRKLHKSNPLEIEDFIKKDCPPFTSASYWYELKNVIIRLTLSKDYNDIWEPKYVIENLPEHMRFDIKYVHHLQNIFYSLTWTDLVIDTLIFSTN